jgi:signal transduction histidine kinase
MGRLSQHLGHRLIVSLRTRFLIGVLATGALALGGTALFAGRSARNDVESLARDRGRVIANSVSANLSSMMVHGSGHQMQLFLSSVKQNALVSDVHIFSRKGVVLASSAGGVGQPTNPRHFALTREGRMAATTEEGPHGTNMVFVQEIENGPFCRNCHGQEESPIGYLDVSVPLDRYERHVRTTLVRSGVLNGIALVLLILGSSLVVSVLVLRPVARLAQAVRRTADGDLDVRVPVEREDELGRLAKDFNAMAEKLRGAQEQVQQSHHENMERAERMASLGELAASLAHEVRNPLGGLSGAVQVLAEHFADDPKHREVVEEMGSLIQRLDKAVNDLLSFARPSRPSLKLLDLNVSVGEVVSLMRKHAARSKVEVVFHPCTDHGYVFADGDQVRHVWVNLILNAYQAMPAGGTLDVRVAVAGDGVQVSFLDTGTGIPEDLREKIFRPFFTTKHTGTGLGLAICDRIVRDHGGDIEVVSSPGEGTCFTVTLPRRGAIVHRAADGGGSAP